MSAFQRRLRPNLTQMSFNALLFQPRPVYGQEGVALSEVVNCFKCVTGPVGYSKSRKSCRPISMSIRCSLSFSIIFICVTHFLIPFRQDSVSTRTKSGIISTLGTIWIYRWTTFGVFFPFSSFFYLDEGPFLAVSCHFNRTGSHIRPHRCIISFIRSSQLNVFSVQIISFYHFYAIFVSGLRIRRYTLLS